MGNMTNSTADATATTLEATATTATTMNDSENSDNSEDSPEETSEDADVFLSKLRKALGQDLETGTGSTPGMTGKNVPADIPSIDSAALDSLLSNLEGLMTRRWQKLMEC